MSGSSPGTDPTVTAAPGHGRRRGEPQASIAVDLSLFEDEAFFKRFKGVRDGSEIPPQLDAWQPAITRSGSLPRYRLQALLGMGGQGFVFNVLDRDTGRTIALKTLRQSDRLTAKVLRFIHEAQVTAQLEHPGIIPVHDLGALPDGTLYYTMKRVEGRSLDRLIREGGAKPERRFELLQIFLRICDTMAFAHAKGVIHRDLKPANIMVGSYGEVLVLDWGLSRLIGGVDTIETLREQTLSDAGKGNPQSDAFLTRAGHAVGTPAYMSPEQASGRREDVDQRSDVFALGVILYEMLAGRSPYLVESAESVLVQVGDGVWRRLASRNDPSIPPQLAAIVDTAMAFDKRDRYKNVAELAADLRSFLADRSISAYNEGLLDAVRRIYRRHRPVARTVIASVAVAAIGISGWYLWQDWRNQQIIDDLRQQGQMHLLQGELRDARRLFDRIRYMKPDDQSASDTLVELKVSLARQEKLAAESEQRSENRLRVEKMLAAAQEAVPDVDAEGLEDLRDQSSQMLALVPAADDGDAGDDALRQRVLALRDEIQSRRSRLQQERREREALAMVEQSNELMNAGDLARAAGLLSRAEEVLPQHPAVQTAREHLDTLRTAERRVQSLASVRTLLSNAEERLDAGAVEDALGTINGAIALIPSQAEAVREQALGLRDRAIRLRDRQQTRAREQRLQARDTAARDAIEGGRLEEATRIVAALAESDADWTGLSDLQADLKAAVEERERDQRRAQADRLLREVETILHRQRQYEQQIEDHRPLIQRLRRDLAEDVENDALRRRLHVTEQQQTENQQELAALQSRRIDLLLKSQALAPAHEGVRRELADYYADRVRRLEAANNRVEAATAAAQGRAYDDEGRYQKLFAGTGVVVVQDADPAPILSRLVANDRRVLAAADDGQQLQPGSHTLAIGRYHVRRGVERWGVWLRRGREYRMPTPLRIGRLPDDVAVLPGGAVYEHDGTILATVSAVLMARREVTAGEYLEFLNAVLEHAPDDLQYSLVPLRADGTPAWARRSDGSYELIYRGSGRPVPAASPVAAITFEAARAYAAWKSKEDGLPWRLPTEAEWRYAAQSGDGRSYVWGMRPDAGLCCSFATSGGSFFNQVPVGSFPDDRNLAGVLDLAGSVAEFVSDPLQPVPGFRSYCGGSFSDADPTRFATMAPARALEEGAASPSVGLRLALSPEDLGVALPE